MRSEGAEPSAAWEVIVFAAVVEPAGDTVGVGSDDNSRHDTPVSRPWAIPSSFLLATETTDLASDRTGPLVLECSLVEDAVRT